MSEENGFVDRPTVRARDHSLTARLRETAVNGKAVPVSERARVSGAYVATLRRYGLKLRVAKQPDGTYLAWCERIAP